MPAAADEILWEYNTGLSYPDDAERLSNGNTLIADSGNNRIIEVTSDGTIVWDYSTGLNWPRDVERLLNGNTLIADASNNRVIEVASDSTLVWEYSTGLNVPVDADRLSNGNTLIADCCNNRIIEVGTPAPPDLTPTAITPNCGYLFDGNNNEVCALIENNGGPASAFNVSIDINGDIQEVAVLELAEGENITVCVTDSTIRTAGDIVAITVTADCNAEVTEDNETNNVSSISETVMYNGYNGKRYTGGEDITTKMTFDLNGDLVYSAGDSYYASGSGGWTNIDVAWTTSDLPVPATATIKEARLYVPYTYAKDGAMPDNYGMTFNGNPETYDVHYWDTKLYDRTYPYYGMLTYDVTANFSTSGNTANFSSLWSGLPTHSGASMRGMMLVVVYEDATEPRRQIFINEEFDMLGSSKCTTPDKATAWAPITDPSINPAMIASARLITFAPGADGTGTAGEGELIFNGQVWNDEWTDNEVHQIGISDRDVTAYLQSTGNEAGFQSNSDWMEASNAILIVEENIFSNNVYLEPADSGVPYCNETIVQIYADTVDLWQIGQINLTYTHCCANVTGYEASPTFSGANGQSTWDSSVDGEEWLTFKIFDPADMVSGTVLIGNLTIHCCDESYCETLLHFAREGEAPAERISKLSDNYGAPLTDIGWHDGTFTCMNLPDLVITEVYGEQQGIGDDYIVHYTVTNEGNAPAAAGHTTTLSIGEIGGPYIYVEDQALLDILAPGQSYTGTFSEVLTMTAPNDEMKVCADTGSDVMELDETNNCEISIYPAGIEISVNAPGNGIDECVDFQEQFTVNIDVDTRNIPVYGIEYVLSFDNEVLHAEWQNEGTFLSQGGVETTMYINTIDNGAGTISFAATRVGDVGGAIDPGTLAVIKFTAIQQGGSSDLILSGVVAANMYGNEIDPVDLIDDSVCVSSNIPPVAAGKSMHKYNNDGQKYICKVYYDPDGSLVNWRWSFGDGNYGTGESVDHIYQSWKWNGASYDPFKVNLTVTDDGEPNQLDNTTGFDVIVYTAGDANGDGKVNILDATIVAYCWEGNDRGSKADLNNDRKVNILDAVIIGTCWGHTAW